MKNRYLIATILVAGVLSIQSCGMSDSVERGQPEATDVSISVGEQVPSDSGNSTSLENPLPSGTPIDTEGWKRLVVVAVGRVPENVVMEYDTEFDPSLDYILVKISGINANGEPVSLDWTVAGCRPAGAVGKAGIVRSVITGTSFRNEQSGIELITFEDNKVLDGVEISGQAIFSIEKGDSSGVIMMQSKNCGMKQDLYVAIGDVAKLPILE
jgi:hypothetical protein